MGLRIKILGVVVCVVFAAWSAFWWYAARTVENASADAIVKAGDRGIAIDCSDKTVRGWPFRMTLVCKRIGVGAQDFQVAANGLRAVAMVYNPSHLIVEADSPVEIAGTQLPGPVTAQWKSGRASLQLSRNIVDRASFVFSDLALDSITFLPLANPTADSVEVHLRRSEQPRDLDVAITSRTVASFFGTVALPEFDLDVLATITDGAHFLVGQSKRFMDRIRTDGGAVDMRRALLTIGEARVEVSGRLSLAENGHISGEPRIAIANVQALGRELGKIPGLDISRIQPFLSVFANFGEKTTIGESPASAVTLAIRDGHVTAGLFPLGRLQPVALD